MSFNIRQLDKIEYDGSVAAERALSTYQDALMEQFAASPEGQVLNPDMGFWARQIMEFGYTYLGTTIAKMTVDNVDEIVCDIFPRKISILNPTEADATIPELIAFWEFLKREYQLPHAKAILELLRQIEPDFYDIMNDSSKFGMAKSMLMLGQQSGFDMQTEEGISSFFHQYNANILAHGPESVPSLEPGADWGFEFNPNPTRPKSLHDPKKKQRRKMAKASQKKNRKKKK